jgi:hypothetical protein
VNGTTPKIEIFAPFGEAFDLTKKILFQPFELQKWLVIGFAAFLASLSGGFEFPGNPLSGWSSREDRRELAETVGGFGPIDEMGSWMIAAIVIVVLFIFAFIVVLMWIGARGRFIFTDCIVYNRGAIVAPWKEFRTQGNSFFLFSLLAVLLIIALVVLALLPLLLPLIWQGSNARPGVGFWIGFAVLMLLVLLIGLSWALVSQLMVPIMYRQRCLAAQAFRKAVGLIAAHPGPLVLYFLFLLVITVAAAMISCVATCLTCCIAAIPYVGTVILLPIPVTLYGFVLLFMRQFGVDYDVWAAIPQAELPPPPLPEPPVPPLDTPPLA